MTQPLLSSFFKKSAAAPKRTIDDVSDDAAQAAASNAQAGEYVSCRHDTISQQYRRMVLYVSVLMQVGRVYTEEDCAAAIDNPPAPKKAKDDTPAVAVEGTCSKLTCQ